MERRVIPKKRIGSFNGDEGRSMRMRQVKGRHKTLDAAERSAYGYMSVSLCGSTPVMAKSFYGGKMKKREIKKEKEVMKRESSVICLTGRSRRWLAPDYEVWRSKNATYFGAGVKPFVIRPAQQKTNDLRGKEKGKDRSERKNRSKN